MATTRKARTLILLSTVVLVVLALIWYLRTGPAIVDTDREIGPVPGPSR